MNSFEILNVFRNVHTEYISEEQKREFAELLAAYLGSREFAVAVTELQKTWSLLP